MKKKLFLLSLVCSCALFSAFAQEREYVIVVHGGAGNMGGLQDDPSEHSLLMMIDYGVFYEFIVCRWRRSAGCHGCD
jgi:hypothetical protein